MQRATQSPRDIVYSLVLSPYCTMVKSPSNLRLRALCHGPLRASSSLSLAERDLVVRSSNLLFLQNKQKHPRSRRSIAASQREESFIDAIKEVFGDTGEDPGHWNFSPEWYGTQGGGWGRDAGNVVFSARSKYNGLVEVTAHEATPVMNSGNPEEWRVLRFNEATRETAMRVERKGEEDSSVVADPETLAQEYLKSMASLFAALYAMIVQDSSGYAGNERPTAKTCMSHDTIAIGDRKSGNGRRKLLCIGIGGGSLPLFLAHYFPEIDIDAVEIDPVVVDAATNVLGLSPSHLPANLNIITDDAFHFLERICDTYTEIDRGDIELRIKVPEALSNATDADGFYDFIIMDAFNGSNTIPSDLLRSDFAALIGRALSKRHVAFFMANLHDVDVPDVVKTFHKEISRASAKGGAPSWRRADKVLQAESKSDLEATCCSFSIDVQQQSNKIFCCIVQSPSMDQRATSMAAGVKAQKLSESAKAIAGERAFRFLAGSRSKRNFQILKS